MVNERVLHELAEVFAASAPLYAVGGFCRDKLLGVVPRDLDICSKLDVESVKTILKNSGFAVSDKCLRLGTVVVSKDGFSAEYTTFRTDSYAEGKGDHRPVDVRFTEDIRLDAVRRDFACNAVYYDVVKAEYLDFAGGIQDIKNKVLRAVTDPEKVFGEDGLRVLRLVRFAAELGFEIEESTFAAAKKNAWRVKDIVPERVFAELDKIFVADTAYPELGIKDGHVRGFNLLDRLGLVETLLPELAALKGLEQPAKHHIYDAYRHSVEAYAVSSPDIRWAALLHDIGKKIAVDAQGNMHGHDVLGANAAENRLRALRMPPARIKETTELVACHMVDLKGDMSENKLRRFIVKHAGTVEKLIKLKYADGYATKGQPVGDIRTDVLYHEMLADGTPMKLSDLPVGGADAAAAGLKGKQIGEALGLLWDEAVVNPCLRDRANALAFLERQAEKHLR